jgi:copper(I)-binding protein
VAFGARGALAHAFPDHAEPAINGTVAQPPMDLSIWFTKTLQPDGSSVEVRDAAGTKVDQGDATLDAKDPALLHVALRSLPPGTYRVAWHALSTDTHATQGDFTFTVGSSSAASSSVKIVDAWGRATPGAAKSGAVYLTITNNGSTTDTLQSVSTPAAAKASVHEITMKNGVMEMRPVTALTIPPGKSVILAPSSYHLMLEGLKAPLKEGQSIPLTLTFALAGKQEVTASIAKVGAMHAGEMSGAGHAHEDMAPEAPGASGGAAMDTMPGMTHMH